MPIVSLITVVALELHSVVICAARLSRQRKVSSFMHSTFGRSHRWAVVLAGGDGTRLQELTRRISGDKRPKQFCSFFEGKSLLDNT